MNKSGWLIINKPVGFTSAKVVAIVKRILKAKKVGHGGTLDPFASGVLPISINNATKTTEYVMDHSKTYLFHLKFGEETDTYDPEGKVVSKCEKIPTESEIESVLNYFIGPKIKQIPPKYSALKINGKRACDLVREGTDVEIKERFVEIDSIKFNGFVDEKTVEFVVDCGRGCYIRSLGVDMAKKLETCGYISKLVRLRVGEFKIENSININDIESISEDKIIDLKEVLAFSQLDCNESEYFYLKNGVAIEIDSNDGIFKVLFKNNLICIAESKNYLLKSIKWLED